MRNFFVAALLLAAGSTIAIAQEPKNEISGTVGRTVISDQLVPNTNFFDNSVQFGKGTSFEVNYGRILQRHAVWNLTLEVPVIFNPDEDLNYGLDQIPRQYSSYFVTPAARVNLIPDLAVSPWISFGGGIGHFVASKDLVFFGTNPGHRIKTTGVLEGGVGLDVRLPKLSHIRFRFEARDDWSGSPPLNIDTGRSRQHNYYIGAGVVYQF